MTRTETKTGRCAVMYLVFEYFRGVYAQCDLADGGWLDISAKRGQSLLLIDSPALKSLSWLFPAEFLAYELEGGVL